VVLGLRRSAPVYRVPREVRVPDTVRGRVRGYQWLFLGGLQETWQFNISGTPLGAFLPYQSSAILVPPTMTYVGAIITVIRLDK
jgi:hypothetical protein